MTKILIIEDDPLMFRMFQRLFEIEGYDVVSIDDGQKGIEKAKEWKPKLILLDIMMPKMNGFEVLDALKADSSVKEIPVIILSNLTGQKEIDTSMSKGAAGYIVKSEHDPDEVLKLIKEILAKNVI
jgi:CheY-like chemotaxis protein